MNKEPLNNNRPLRATRTAQGQRPTAQGQRPTAQGQRPTAQGQRPTAQGQHPTAQGQRPTAQAQRPTAQAQRPTAQGQRPTVQGQRPTAQGQRPTAQGQRPTAQGQRIDQNGTRLPAVRPSAELQPHVAAKPVKLHDRRPTEREDDISAGAGNVVSSLLKAIIYITCVLIISAALGYFGITAGNDVFAFVKSDSQIEVELGAKPTIRDIAEELAEKDVIRYPGVFRIYAKLRKKTAIEFLSGQFTVSPSMSYDSLIAAFTPSVTKEQISITIPEGFTVDEIITLFTEQYHMGTREGFITAIQQYPFDYWFVEALDTLPEGRKYRLEGYLYPDTYYFFTDWNEVNILYKILDNFSTKFDRFSDVYLGRCETLGMSVDQIITLASMIQMEGKYSMEYGDISSVFHNRLNNPSQTQGKLESDATIQYVLEERTENLTSDQLNTDSPYNTYLYGGLPPGPISNPTRDAINYALYPNETAYYYFVASSSGYSLFAETYSEHLANVSDVEKGLK